MSAHRMAVLFFVLTAPMAQSNLVAADDPNAPITYRAARDFLAKHTQVLELTNERGGRVAVCPEYQGRVMTSTAGGLDGPSYGWINKAFIEKQTKDARFNNYGGEDRFWLGPEGGQFSLWFAAGAEQKLDNWFTPAALNEGAFQVTSNKEDPAYYLNRRIQFENASKTRFDLDVARNVRLLAGRQFHKLFGEEAQKALDETRLNMIGFETANTIINRGPAMSKAQGLVAIWILGQFPPGAQTQIIVPYCEGSEARLGPVVKADYFGPLPAERLQTKPEAILFLGDGGYRSKIGVSQRRAKAVAGSIDRAAGVLTLVHYTLPKDPPQQNYVNNAWELPQREPFVGDVFNSYNDGPPEPGKPSLGGFYELESLSDAQELGTGKSLTHVRSTFHIQGPPGALVKIVKAALGIDIPEK